MQFRLKFPYFSADIAQRANNGNRVTVTNYHLQARNTLLITKTDLGIYQLEFLVLGFGFYYYNPAKRG